MPDVRYHIAGGLAPEQLGQVHRAALRVVEEIGVEVTHPEMLQAIAGEAGVRVNGTRVRLNPELVDHVAADYRRKAGVAPPEPDRFTIQILSGYAFQVLDALTDELRPMSTSDCIATAKLVDTLHEAGVMGGTPGLPQDVPVRLREILAYKIGCEYSRTCGRGDFTSVEAGDFIYRMAQAAGKPFALPVFVLSPLRIEGNSVAMALDYGRRRPPVPITVHGMPLLGVTTPFWLAGAFVEHVATVLAAVTCFRLMGLKDNVDFYFYVFPFGLKYGTTAYGTPDHILSYLVGTQINRYYGRWGWSCQAFHTNAIFPDAHSVAQRAAFAALAALNGARSFHFGGMLGIDKVFSAEQLLIDVEIVEYLRWLVRGVRFDEETLSFAALKEVGPGGTFIIHPATVANCRNTWASELFPDLSPEQWSAGPRYMLKDRTRQRAKRLLEGYDFQLDPHVKRELDDLYEAATRQLA